MDAAKDLTELVAIDPERVDGVKSPASGFPILLMKALEAQEETPEPDTDPPATDTVKDADVADQDDTQTPAAPEPQAEKDEPVEKSVDELVQEAVAKAMKDRDEAIQGLRDELAALKDTPIPGGPVITVPQGQRTDAEKAAAQAEAEHFERLSKSTGDRELAGFYERKAAGIRKANA